MRDNPERLAWLIVLASFFVCVGLTVAIPLGVHYYILHARIGQHVTLEVQRPPLSVTLAGRGLPVSIVEHYSDVPVQTLVATGAAAGQLVMYAPQADSPSPVIATVQLYDNTKILLSSARSPRFASSYLPHQITLEMQAGRSRINVSSDDGRQTIIEVKTPHGVTTLTEGSYEVKVNGRTTEVTVRNGQADVTDDVEHTLSLTSAERAIIEDGKAIGPLLAERSLLVNGDFRQPLAEIWESYDKDVQQSPTGTVEAITFMGRPAVWFHRDGIGHAEVGIRQQINYDVRDFTSLLLQLSVQVQGQSLPGCGSAGSECPIIARIDYKDIYGTDRQWYHGFYSVEHVEPDFLQHWSEQVPFQTWHVYDSGNLIEAFEESPALIKAVTIYASGHSFNALVTEVGLWAQE